MSAKALAALILLLLTACRQPPPAALAQEAYVWQQAWTPALSDSLAGPAADGLAGWRVLIAEQVAGGSAPRWRNVAPDWPALARTGRPLTAVLRLDGQLSALGDVAGDPASDALRNAIVERWQTARRDAGVALALEIDHDCATRRLPGYASFLRTLRADVHARGGTLSITALPAWLARPADLRELLAAVDAHVLQVHAVSRPGQGLWSAAQTDAWLDDWARLTPHPFALALPAVGSAVRVSASGDVLAVHSSQPVAARDWPADSRELSLLPDPLALAAYLQQLQAHRPERLRAVVWFRWPLPGDANAFTPASFALLRRDPAAFTAASRAAPVQLTSEAPEPATPDGPVRRWLLVNPGATDLRLPAELNLPPGCEPLLPLNGAQLSSGPRVRLSPDPVEVRLLPAGARLAVALARCPSNPASAPP